MIFVVENGGFAAKATLGVPVIFRENVIRTVSEISSESAMPRKDFSMEVPRCFITLKRVVGALVLRRIFTSEIHSRSF